MNTTKAPLDDVNCRKALAYAFDYEAAINIVRLTKEIAQGKASNGPLPAGMLGHNATLPTFKKDMNKAKSYLNQCQYKPSEHSIEVSWIAEVPLEERFALMMQSNFKKLGFRSTVKKIPWALFQEQVSKPETTPHITQIFVSSNTGDPDALLYQQYHSSSGGKWSASEWLNNQEVDRLLAEGRRETDVEKRAVIYRQLSQLIVDLQPAIYGYDQLAVFPMNKRVAWPALEDRSQAYGMSAYNLRFHEVTLK